MAKRLGIHKHQQALTYVYSCHSVFLFGIGILWFWNKYVWNTLKSTSCTTLQFNIFYNFSTTNLNVMNWTPCYLHECCNYRLFRSVTHDGLVRPLMLEATLDCVWPCFFLASLFLKSKNWAKHYLIKALKKLRNLF